MPSEKYSLPLSSLRLANARTATDLALTSDLGIAEPAGVGWTAAFFLRESSSCNSSVIFLPTALLCEIVSHAFTDENMSGISAIHHSLCDVDAYAGNVFALVCILHLMDRAAVDSHSHRQTWLRAQSVADLQGAFGRLFH